MEVFNGAIDPIAFNIFGWPVHWYGIIIGLGILLAYKLIVFQGKEENIDEDTILDLVTVTVLGGFVGARIYYVVFQWDYYRMHPEEIIQIWHGGIAVYGGIIAGVLILYIMCKKYKLNTLRVFDMTAPAIMLAQSIGRWGNFINQEAYGGEVSKVILEKWHLPKWLIDQMYIEGIYHHPTFLYESLWNLIGVGILLLLRYRVRKRPDGLIAASYFIWYGIGRAWIEGLRSDSLYWGSFRVSQLLSILLIICSTVWIIYQYKQKK